MDQNNSTDELLGRMYDSITELTSIIKVISYSKIKDSLLDILSSHEKLKVYDAMDGESSVSEISEKTGVNTRYISEWGREWESVGIVGPSKITNVSGRRQRLFDLELFGISLKD